MKQKIIALCIMMLLMTTAGISAVGILNIQMETYTTQPMVEWEKTFGEDEFDYFRCIQQTSDGGYLAFGETEQDDMNYAWLLKLDADGNEEWNNVNQDLNGSVYDREDLANMVIETNDGSFIACGFSTAYYSDYSIWSGAGYLWKIDASGQTDWVKRYQSISETESEAILSIFPFNIIELDGGYALGGLSVVGLNPDTGAYTLDGALMKTDENGNIDWYQTWDSGNDYEALNGLCATDDGGYFLTGLSTTFTMSAGACWALKTDSEGNKQWEKKFDGPALDYSAARGCGQTDDGGFIVAGATYSYGAGKSDLWVIKTDASGNKEWDKTFGGSGHDQSWGMQILPDDGYVFGTVYNQQGFGGTLDDTWIIKTDADGNAEWKYQIEESGRQVPLFITRTSDEGFIVAGRTGQPDHSGTDAYIVKIAAFENQRPSKPTIDGPPKGKPDTEYTFTASSSDPDGGALQYRWDWGDGNYSEWSDTQEASYTWSSENNFQIRVMSQDNDGGESEWSDPFKFSTPKNKRNFINYFHFWIDLFIECFQI